jgi:ribonucleoside-triphosphate reductase
LLKNLYIFTPNLIGENMSEIFKLSDNFLEKYKGKQPKWGPLGYFTYKRTYARRIDEEQRSEEFWETLKRVVEGTFTIQKRHCLSLGLPWKQYEAQMSAQKMFEKMWEFKFLPPGRGLWIMGTEFIDKHGSAALNNCAFTSTHDIDIKGTKAFEFLMDMLMLGVGVGFDTKGADKITIKYPKKYDKGHRYTFVCPDNREGWVECLRIMLKAFFEGMTYPEYDFSQVRPAGAPIKGFGGTASGPGPLIDMLNEISDLLMDRVGDKMTSTDIVDVMNLIGKCVVAGNVRRSAQIAFGHIDDEDYITMKDPEKNAEQLQNHRWASNNSIFATVGMDYTPIIDSIAKNGEPGIVWLENAQNYSRMTNGPDYKDELVMGTNPCGEQSLESFELCCLCETFPSNHDTYEEYEETLKYAFMYAKTVTLVNTHWPETNAVMLKNRRIGLSQSGIIDAFVKHGRREILRWCDKGYKYLEEKDKSYSDWLVTPRSVKITTVKPSGTISLLPGVSPGIHYPHSKYYIRRVRVMEDSSLIPIMEQAGYHIEDDYYSQKTKVISFPVKEDNFQKSKVDATLWEQFENAAAYQKHWADNQVSITITFKKDEVVDLPIALEYFEDRLKGASFLPITDHGYKQAPYETITEKEYIKMSKGLKEVDLSDAYDAPEGEKYCTTDACEIKLEAKKGEDSGETE